MVANNFSSRANNGSRVNNGSRANNLGKRNRLNNIVNSPNNSSKGSSNKIIIIVAVVIVVALLGVFGYYLYQYFNKKKNLFKTKTLISGIYDASVDKQITNSSMPSSMSGNEYNINVWVYVNDYTYRKEQDKCLFFRGNISSSEMLEGSEHPINKDANPSVWLLKHQNTLRIVTGLDTNYSDSDCGPQTESCGGIDMDYCDVQNFPLQTWVCLNISQRNNVLDVFLNGKLVKSCIMKGSPTTNTGDLFISKKGSDGMTGFNGYLSKLEFANKALSPSDIMKRYKSGPEVNL